MRLDLGQPRLVLAMDHARAMGAVDGLDDPGAVLDRVLEAGADAVMTSFGVVKRWRGRLIGRVPTFLRLDGGPSLVKERWLENSEWTLLHTLDDAARLGVDGVCLMYFMGAPCELRTLEIVARVCGEAMARGLPVMVEALPCRHPAIPDTNDARMMADACRIAFEHGADILKTYFPHDRAGFARVVATCPAPVLIAGGPRLPDDRAVLAMVADSVAVGGRGVVFGRNIWQHARPERMVRALAAALRGAGPEVAAAQLEG
jgi:DhnA family fructose-bisphosphate aldolase class Ia